VLEAICEKIVFITYFTKISSNGFRVKPDYPNLTGCHIVGIQNT